MNNFNLQQSTAEIDFEFDQQHIWHPYTSMTQPVNVNGVVSATGCELTLSNGDTVIDGTSSWWACVHGYHHPQIIEAMQTQLTTLSHVMFGGLTHAPAINLCKRLVEVTSDNLTKVFLADSGSISVEVAIKMAIQYWQGQQHVHINGQQISTQNKQRMLTVKGGYHGDTFATMSVCDPNNGMHTMFGDSLVKQLFAPAPSTPFGEKVCAQDTQELETILQANHQEIAALIIEPIMQGAGGMHFYSADYLKAVRALCDKYHVLLILDEIATGFGRTGKLFAYEHANIEADILCLGKALTGGYISLAATMCSDEVALGISQSPAGVFMHGPTFMANPLACAAAQTSIALLQSGQWQQQVSTIAQQMEHELAPALQFPRVKDVRILGAVGVIEMNCKINIGALQQAFVELGVWIRPFGNVIYITPPYIITSAQLTKLTQAMKNVIQNMTSEQAAGNTLSNG